MEDITAAIREVQEELSLPRAVRAKLEEIIQILEGPGDSRLKASKVLAELDVLADNSALPSYVRTQLWNISSMLETV